MTCRVSVVIPTHNRTDSLMCLLKQIQTQAEIGHLTIFTTIILAGPQEETLQAVKAQFPLCQIIHGQEDWWWTTSVNHGCLNAIKENADAILLLNDDLELHPHYFQNLFNAVQKYPHAIIGSLNLTREPQPRIFFSGAKSYRWLTGILQKYHPFLAPHDHPLQGIHPSIVLPGRGLWIPSEMFAQIGFFDEIKLPQYKSDYDFVFRAHQHNIETLISWDAVIYTHPETCGSGTTFTKQPIWRYFFSLFEKHSRTNLCQNTRYYWRIHPRWGLLFFPCTAIMILSRQFYCLITQQKYTCHPQKAKNNTKPGVSNPPIVPMDN